MMMKGMKKTLSLVAVGAVALTATACGSTDTGTNTDTGSSSEETKKLIVAAEASYAPFLEEVKADFEAEHNVTVEIQEKGMFDTLDALALDGPAGLAPDVFIMPHDRIGSLAATGNISPVTLTGDYTDVAVTAATYEGKTYIAPAAIEAVMLFYNKDLLPEAPTTFEELEALAADSQYAFTNEEGRSTAFLAKLVDFYVAYGIIGGYGGNVFGDNNTNPDELGLNNAGGVEGLAYIQKWDGIMPIGMQDEQSSYDFMMQYFTEGKTAAIINGPWAATDVIDAGINVGFAALPTLPGGNTPTPFGGVKGWGVSAYSTEQELANEWVNYVTNAENGIKFFEMNNEITPNPDVLTEIEASDNELAKTVIEQFAVAVPTPNIPEMAEVWEFKAALFDVAQGKDPQAAADSAAQLVKDNIVAKHSN
ncbi:MAG: extracellular solute-binding protein [Culicoidibacterales bacterium]